MVRGPRSPFLPRARSFEEQVRAIKIAMSTSSADSVASATFVAPSDEVLKMCPKCPEGQQYKPLGELGSDRCRTDGKCTYCRDCKNRIMREYCAKRKRDSNAEEDPVGEGDDGDDYEDGEDDLYVMENSRIPGEVKIGRSSNPENRKKSLQASQNFRINLLGAFPDARPIESRVHAMLAYCRVLDVPGREWFKCSTQMAFAAIGTALAEQKNGVKKMAPSWKDHLKQCAKEYRALKEKAKKTRALVSHRIKGKQAHLVPTRRNRHKNDID